MAPGLRGVRVAPDRSERPSSAVSCRQGKPEAQAWADEKSYESILPKKVENRRAPARGGHDIHWREGTNRLAHRGSATSTRLRTRERMSNGAEPNSRVGQARCRTQVLLDRPRRSRKRTHVCSPERTQRVRGVMPGKGSRGTWNKCGGFIAAFMPRKPLDALEGAHARGSAGDGFYHPRRLPPGEGGVWGDAPGFVGRIVLRAISPA